MQLIIVCLAFNRTAAGELWDEVACSRMAPWCLKRAVCCFSALRSCGRWFGCSGSLQVVRRGHCPAADGGRGAAAEPPVRLRRGLHPGAPGHPLPEAGHAGHPPHWGELPWPLQLWSSTVGTCTPVCSQQHAALLRAGGGIYANFRIVPWVSPQGVSLL